MSRERSLRAWAGRNKGGSPSITSAGLPPKMREWCDRDPKGYPREDNPPSWVDDEAAWERAKKEVRKNWGDYDEPWAVVATVYQNMAGK